jgi:hypothetical protein
VDVTNVIKGPGLVTLVLTGVSGKEAEFASREAGAGAPVLEVTLGGGSQP